MATNAGPYFYRTRKGKRLKYVRVLTASNGEASYVETVRFGGKWIGHVDPKRAKSGYCLHCRVLEDVGL